MSKLILTVIILVMTMIMMIPTIMMMLMSNLHGHMDPILKHLWSKIGNFAEVFISPVATSAS